ncbi:hypothetical protein A7318_18275 [Pseudomonas lurida]|nr:hypothetical protein A7318_18275 [Pseudomonas lurida]
MLSITKPALNDWRRILFRAPGPLQNILRQLSKFLPSITGYSVVGDEIITNNPGDFIALSQPKQATQHLPSSIDPDLHVSTSHQRSVMSQQ